MTFITQQTSSPGTLSWVLLRSLQQENSSKCQPKKEKQWPSNIVFHSQHSMWRQNIIFGVLALDLITVYRLTSHAKVTVMVQYLQSTFIWSHSSFNFKKLYKQKHLTKTRHEDRIRSGLILQHWFWFWLCSSVSVLFLLSILCCVKSMLGFIKTVSVTD